MRNKKKSWDVCVAIFCVTFYVQSEIDTHRSACEYSSQMKFGSCHGRIPLRRVSDQFLYAEQRDSFKCNAQRG